MDGKRERREGGVSKTERSRVQCCDPSTVDLSSRKRERREGGVSEMEGREIIGGRERRGM